MENKVDKFDFTINAVILCETDCMEIIFRFLPKLSHCHSFDENIPKSWQDVYKVYYAYQVVEYFEDACVKADNENVVFSTVFDECSRIKDVANYLLKNTPIAGSVKETFVPFGDGVTWELSKEENSNTVKFVVWDSDNTGYRFGLDQEKAHQFGVFLNDCCEYMLAHGEPI